MARVLLLGPARQLAGVSRLESSRPTVAGIVQELVGRFGPEFETLVGSSVIWVDGVPADLDETVGDESEVSILPPVSGGAV